MSAKRRFLAALLACAVPISGVCIAAEESDGAPNREAARRVVRLPGFGGEQQPYWIGAMCVPVDPALRAQLKLDEGAGLLVSNIMPESPADKAGLKQFDVITAIDGESLEGLQELVAAVGAAGEKELKFDVIRGGKKQTIGVTPSKRPDRDMLTFNPPPLPGAQEHVERMKQHLERMRASLPEAEVRRMEEWIERMQKGDHRPLRLQMFGPGVVMEPIEVPAGTKIAVNRRGDGSAIALVERDGKSWQVTEETIDQLPEDLRGPVKAMLSQPGPIAIQSNAGKASADAKASGSGDSKVQVEIRTDESNGKDIVVAPQGRDEIERRMREETERLQRQVDQLRKQVEELNKLKDKLPAVPKKNAPAKSGQQI